MRRLADAAQNGEFIYIEHHSRGGLGRPGAPGALYLDLGEPQAAGVYGDHRAAQLREAHRRRVLECVYCCTGESRREVVGLVTDLCPDVELLLGRVFRPEREELGEARDVHERFARGSPARTARLFRRSTSLRFLSSCHCIPLPL